MDELFPPMESSLACHACVFQCVCQSLASVMALFTGPGHRLYMRRQGLTLGFDRYCCEG